MTTQISAINGFRCKVCDAEALHELDGYSDLPRVTSDCKPFPPGGRIAICGDCGAIQKPADALWQREIDEIYKNYTIYFQSNGVEQAVFDPNGGFNLRSDVLLKKIDSVSPLGDTGSAIDVGCGRGTFLRAFSGFRPGWRLAGHELNRSNEDVLRQIPKFQELYTCPLSELLDKFDLISMVHALEHFEEPFAGLRDAVAKLSPRGLVTVEVPNCAESPFDLIVADHASHFMRNDLARMAHRAGLSVVALATDWMSKELSFVGTPGAHAPQTLPDPSTALSYLQNRVAWLRATMDAARQARRAGSQFGIFGTSVAAMWVFGELENDVRFFVDEDPAREGELLGRPVYNPSRIPDNSVVFLALPPAIAARVAQRIRQTGVQIAVPPDLPQAVA